MSLCSLATSKPKTPTKLQGKPPGATTAAPAQPQNSGSSASSTGGGGSMGGGGSSGSCGAVGELHKATSQISITQLSGINVNIRYVFWARHLICFRKRPKRRQAFLTVDDLLSCSQSGMFTLPVFIFFFLACSSSRDQFYSELFIFSILSRMAFLNAVEMPKKLAEMKTKGTKQRKKLLFF